MKYLSRLVLLILVVLMSSVAYSQTSSALPHSDTQSWNDIQLALPVNNRLDVMLLGTLRVGRDITNFVDERVGIGVSYKLNKYITVAPNYQYIAMRAQSQELRAPLHWRSDFSIAA